MARFLSRSHRVCMVSASAITLFICSSLSAVLLCSHSTSRLTSSITASDPPAATHVHRWVQWETSILSSDSGYDRRMLAQIGLSDFLLFADANRLDCKVDSRHRHSCVRVVSDCSRWEEVSRKLPEDLFGNPAIPRNTTMAGCWEFSAAQWSNGRMIAIDYYFHPYY